MTDEYPSKKERFDELYEIAVTRHLDKIDFNETEYMTPEERNEYRLLHAEIEGTDQVKTEFSAHEPTDQVDILFLYVDYIDSLDNSSRIASFWDWYATDYQELIR